MVYVSAKTGFGIHDLKERMTRLITPDGSGKTPCRRSRTSVGPLLSWSSRSTSCPERPPDPAAAAGNPGSPDSGAMPIVCRESELAAALDSLKKKPSLVITDSQVFPLVDRMTPKEIRLTSFFDPVCEI